MLFIEILYDVYQLPIPFNLAINSLSQILLGILSLNVVKEHSSLLGRGVRLGKIGEGEVRFVFIYFEMRFKHSHFVLESVYFLF